MSYNIGDMVEMTYTGSDKPEYLMVLGVAITKGVTPGFDRHYKCYNVETGENVYSYLPVEHSRKVNNAS
jgi:hypothetical protein